MNYDEYVDRHASITRSLVSSLFLLLSPLLRGVGMLTRRKRVSLLVAMYPVVEEHRYQSGELARQFYDEQRRQHVPGEEPPDVFLAGYEPDWLETAMEDAFDEWDRQVGGQPDADDSFERIDNALANVLSSAAKEVEGGGRRTLIRAVEKDPRVVRWARVQGGEDSCAFCLMLISRGAVYTSARDAGLTLSNANAVELYRQFNENDGDASEVAGKQLRGFMDQWHTNCDCKVVPVFDLANWPGKEEAEAAYRIWEKRTKGYGGQEAINSLRRHLYDGSDGDGDSVPVDGERHLALVA